MSAITSPNRPRFKYDESFRLMVVPKLRCVVISRRILFGQVRQKKLQLSQKFIKGDYFNILVGTSKSLKRT